MRLEEIFDNQVPSIEDQANMLEAYWQQLLIGLEKDHPNIEFDAGVDGGGVYVGSIKSIFLNVSGDVGLGVSIYPELRTDKHAMKFKQKVEALPDYQQAIKLWVRHKS